ncbi:uncharacterized protein LOC134723767 [Mytilus trossulus]|uniref:uncharacterized protein LOC134723767 n=1 Tax=Mytilus trossulus TaxID=6551 RepID=UPI0030045861
MKQYKWGWDFLVYLFGIMFLLLGSYNVFNIVRLIPMQHLFSRNYFVMLNILIAIIAILRGLYLLIDAQNRNETFPIILNYFLYSTAFPCLTSAFSILFYALLLATKVQVLSTKIQKLTVLIGIIIFHFGLSIVTDIIVGLFARAQVLMLICQLFYIVWGTILFAGFLYIFTKLRTAAIRRSKISIHRGHTDRFTYQTRRTAIRRNVISVSSDYTSRKIKRGKKAKYNLNTSVKITLIAAILGLVCVLLEIYGIFGVYKIQVDNHLPEPWPYFSYQFLLRLVEFCMCFLMVYVTTQSVNFQRTSWHDIVERVYETLGCICCTHQQNETKSFEFISPAFEVNNNIDEIHEWVTSKIHGQNRKEKPSLHARFKERFVNRFGRSLTTNLPDLVHGAVIQEKRNASIDLSSSFSVEIHEESQNNSIFIIEMEFNVKDIETIKCDFQINKPQTCDSSSIDRISFVTSETFGSNLNLSAVSLMESMGREYEQAFERRFEQTSLHKSASDKLCTDGLEGSGLKLLNSEPDL